MSLGGEWMPRPNLDTLRSEIYHERADDVPIWKSVCYTLKARYWVQSKMGDKARKYLEYFKEVLLEPEYLSIENPNGLFVSDWKVERDSPLIEVRDHIVLKGFTNEEMWGIDQYLFKKNRTVTVIPGMFKDSEETLEQLAVPEEALDEYTILSKMDRIERMMSDYRKQNPDSDLFNDVAILNAIGKRKEYSDLKKQLYELE
jgi:hypothetical protein